MKKRSLQPIKSIRFRRWSRKSYAVFSGLNKVISIGRVSAGICDQAVLKTNSLSFADAALSENILFLEEKESEDETVFLDLQLKSNTLHISTDIPVGCQIILFIHLKLEESYDLFQLFLF